MHDVGSVRWCEAMDFTETQPEEFLSANWHEAYESQIRAIWWQLVRLNTSVFILEKIAAFPFHLFALLETPFWKSVYEGLFEASVMIIWRIALDTGRDAFAITQLKSEIRENMRYDGPRRQLDSELKRIGFNKGLASIERKVRDLRRNYIAHFSRSWNIDPDPERLRPLCLCRHTHTC